MKRWERWSFGLLSLLVALTGVGYFWMKYLMVSDDAFAVVNHPLQPLMLSLHIVVSPALLLVFGIILNSHIMRKLQARRSPNRKSGLVSLATFAAMTLSGYLLQVASSDGLLRALLVVHLTTGVVFVVTYGAHLAISYRLSRVYVPARGVQAEPT